MLYSISDLVLFDVLIIEHNILITLLDRSYQQQSNYCISLHWNWMKTFVHKDK